MSEDYQIYKEIVSIEDYFSKWSDEDRKAVKGKEKDIYDRYVIKAKIFQRDNFKCQNIDCSTPNDLLTWHHIKKRSNGGEDKERNGVTVCDTCHKDFHNGNIGLTFSNGNHLPSHIRGHTLWEHVENEFDWKAHKAKMREFRKKLIRNGQAPKMKLSDVVVLLNWLYNYNY